MNHWICSQQGAREKYAIPRAIHGRGRLQRLYTDLWLKPGVLSLISGPKSKGRFHNDLRDAAVRSFNGTFLYRKLVERLLKKRESLDQLFDLTLSSYIKNETIDGPLNFFGYSYSSRESMKTARSRRYTTILGQINPGPGEAAIVVEEFKRFHGGIYKPTVPDEKYWDRWREEISFSDKVLVNSPWSMKLLTEAGVDPKKCVVVPLAYEAEQVAFEKKFPSSFERQSPLKLLYLGGIGIRKGFHLLTDAMRQLTSQPVHLDVVGVLKGPGELLKNLPPNITFHGPVPTTRVAHYYQSSGLFVFPTLSDGFGLTQLEAQAHRLPMIVSKFCAPVITHMQNGFVLDEVTVQQIKDAVMAVLDQPEILERWSRNAVPIQNYSLSKLSAALFEL